MNPPSIPVPVIRDQDAEHLRLLSIFHYVTAGLGAFGMCFIGVHYSMMSSFLLHASHADKSGKGGPPPEIFMDVFKWFYLLFGVAALIGTVLNVLAAGFLARRRNRTFCLITAGLNCLHMPIGTLLGVFTIIVLNRDSVRAKFADAKLAAAAAA
jgi:hypothetical protein